MKGVLVCHGRVLLQEEGAEEEEAKEGEADNLCPASQPGSGSQCSDETRRSVTGRDPELVFTSIRLDRDSSGDWMEPTSLVLAASCWQCCTSGLNTVRNGAVSGASSKTRSCSRSGRNMLSVRSGYSADWEAGVWPGCHTPCSKLARVDTIWVMVTDSTVDSGGTNACLPHQMPHSPSHRLLADGLSRQRGCHQVSDDQLASKDRHGHEMTAVGPAD